MEQPYGPNPRGILILDASGRYATVRARPDRPKFKSSSQPTTDELVAARAFGANFGTWSVSEADKTLTLHVDRESRARQIRRQLGIANGVLNALVAQVVLKRSISRPSLASL
jgi:hypothetical protein